MSDAISSTPKTQRAVEIDDAKGDIAPLKAFEATQVRRPDPFCRRLLRVCPPVQTALNHRPQTADSGRPGLLQVPAPQRQQLLFRPVWNLKPRGIVARAGYLTGSLQNRCLDLLMQRNRRA
jgi:hypothetical protein